MGQKILWDCHMHSSFSADSETPMEDMIQTAVDKGLTGICFTEHLDPDYPETPENLDFSLDIPAYRQRLFELADAFRDQIHCKFRNRTWTSASSFRIFFRTSERNPL